MKKINAATPNINTERIRKICFLINSNAFLNKILPFLFIENHAKNY
jgi:hypothetical protein